MIREAKWFILLLVVSPGFEQKYEVKKYCDKLYSTSSIVPKLINIEDLIGNYESTEVLVNTSFIVKTPSPGATAYICLNVVNYPHVHTELTYDLMEEAYYCTLYTGSFISFRVENKEDPAICPKRTFLRNRGSWFATNLVLFTSERFVLPCFKWF